MTQQEFFERTKVQVSDNEFWAIHSVYAYSELDKDDFCKMWCKMNATRVKAAKTQIKRQQREEAYKNILNKWYMKYDHNNLFWNNYSTYIAHMNLSAKEVEAMSFAGIQFKEWSTLSDIHMKVGEYLRYC